MARLKCSCGEIIEIELDKEPTKLECKNSECNNTGPVSENNVVNFTVLDP